MFLMNIKKFLIYSSNCERDSYVWNMIASLLQSFQSVIMLMIITRVVGLSDAGVFTIAYANANLFVIIGKYGVRYFQISDIKKQFTFAEYKSSRILTLIIMLIVSVGYALYSSDINHYTVEKLQIVIWMCLFKAIDAYEDVFIGLYQNRNRLDIAAKSVSVRMIFTLIIFSISIVGTHSLLAALIITTVFTFLTFTLFTKWTYKYFHEKETHNFKNVLLLIHNCFPLFAGTFLAFYIGNAPKYAIDSILNSEMQACYGFISMPVFVIGVFSNFVFTPILYKLSVLWNEKNIKAITAHTLKQTVIIAIFTIFCILGGYYLGIPILSVIYNTDLTNYKWELVILLIGGGFFALTELLSKVITIVRYQKLMLYGYATVAFLALLISKRMIEEYSIMGAALLYTGLMAILSIFFVILTIYGLLSKNNKGEIK